MKTTTLWLRAALITTYALAGLPAVSAQTPVVPQATDASMPQTATPAITLNDAITRARANEPTFANAVATAKNAKLDQSIARAALLPNVSAENQFLYTQGGAGVITNPIKAQQPDLQTTSAPRFIANNAVHEYINQAVVTETIGGQQFNALRRRPHRWRLRTQSCRSPSAVWW